MGNRKYIDELYEFYSEEIHHNIIKDKEYVKISSTIANDFENLYEALNKEQKNLLEKILEDNSERGTILDKYIFNFSFSLATKLFTEGLQENTNINEIKE